MRSRDYHHLLDVMHAEGRALIVVGEKLIQAGNDLLAGPRRSRRRRGRRMFSRHHPR